MAAPVPSVPCSLGAVAFEGAGHADRELPEKQAAVWAETTPFPKGEASDKVTLRGRANVGQRHKGD